MDSNILGICNGITISIAFYENYVLKITRTQEIQLMVMVLKVKMSWLPYPLAATYWHGLDHTLNISVL